jgi:lipopolysaccharide export system permease protein
MLITRYLGKNLVYAAGFVALALTAVIWLTQSMKILELIANSDAPPSLFLRLVILSLPKFMEIILPISLVIAVLFTYNRMIMDNEIVVMRACGADQLALARPALIAAATVTLILLALGTYFSPKSTTQMILLREDVKARYSAFLLREGVFNTFGKDLTVYLRARDASGDLYGLMIHDARDKKKPPVTVTAKRGHVVMDNGAPTIVVFDGLRQQLDQATGALTRLYFSRYTLEIQGLEDTGPARWRNPSERTLTELFSPNMNDPLDRISLGVFAAEICNRLVSPLNVLGLTLMALCCILLGPFERRGQARKVALAAVLVAAGEVINISLVSLMKKNAAVMPVFVAATVAPPLLCYWLLHLQGERALMILLRKWRNRGAKALPA